MGRQGRVGGPPPQGPVPVLAGLMDGNGCSIGTHILSYKPILLLPYILEGLRACSRSEHKFLSVSLSFAFGLFRYLPFVSFPAEGMLIDLIVLAIGVCYLR